jgi:predicted nucleic acid-binding protein
MWALIDTSVYIGHWEQGLYESALAKVRASFVIRHSAVVLSELRRGARTREVGRTVNRLYALAREVWEPSSKDWWETGQIIRTVGDAHDWELSKRRDFQNDTLIALTARRHGATVVTANRGDFELLGKRLGVSIFAV